MFCIYKIHFFHFYISLSFTLSHIEAGALFLTLLLLLLIFFLIFVSVSAGYIFCVLVFFYYLFFVLNSVVLTEIDWLTAPTAPSFILTVTLRIICGMLKWVNALVIIIFFMTVYLYFNLRSERLKTSVAGYWGEPEIHDKTKESCAYLSVYCMILYFFS